MLCQGGLASEADGKLMLQFTAETGVSMASTLAVARGLRPVDTLQATMGKKKLSSWKSLSSKRRFVTLSATGLQYYTKQGDSTPKGFLDITPLTTAALDSSGGYCTVL